MVESSGRAVSTSRRRRVGGGGGDVEQNRAGASGGGIAADPRPIVMHYTTGVGVRWTASADKHGVPHADALHAMTHAVYAESEFDEPRLPGHLRPTLFIGPPRDPGGLLLEVMVEAIPPDELVVFHVMPVRAKHLRRIPTEGDTR